MKNWSKYPLILLFSFILACGNEGRNKDLEEENPGSSEIVPCELLTIEQVKTVLPGSGEGFTASSGESLMKGVKSYQCSYSDEKYHLLTVIVHVASAKEDFDWIKPRENIGDDYKDARKLNIGDGGWLYGDPEDMKVKVVKGYTVVELNLSSDDASEKGDSLIELASIVVKKIGQS
jgi:hypothetical protein